MTQTRLVLFDLDGTLADTAPDIARATNRVLAEAGRPPLSLATVRALVSFGARPLLRAGFSTPPPEAELERLLSRLFLYYGEAPANDTEVFPGLDELIVELAASGIRWGIVSNKPAALVAPIVASFALAPAPVCLIGGDSLARKKPDPLPLLEACRLADVAPEEAVYVGDAEIDAKSASAAGMPLVIAGFGYAPSREETRDWGAAHYAGSVDELARILLGKRRIAAASA